jgi:hypothetical protein
MFHTIWIYLINIFVICNLFGQEFLYYSGAEYNSKIIKPEQVIGFEIGKRPIRHHEAIQYLKQLAENSPRVLFVEAGKTYENRLLCYVVISSEKNIQNIEKVKSDLAQYADPRKAFSGNLNELPGVAWMMYSIHGDELSGTDAGILLAYQLAAGTDAKTLKILDELIIGIDPMENPDGRERFLDQMQQWGTDIVNSDMQSIQHTGVWPYGRGNHYLFDLNRDWFILAHPESRARVRAINEWHPQLVVDAHEMGNYDTFLFHPPREPINHHIVKTVRKWWDIFSADQSRAFDQFSWSYYTQEWADDWFPGYGSSLPAYSGAVSILYEQAGTEGTVVKKPSEKLSTFQDAVHRQFISSMANLTTAAEHRIELLKDYSETRKQACGNKGAYYIFPNNNSSRLNRLIERLMMNGIEIYTVSRKVHIKNALNYYDSKKSTVSIDTDAVVIPLNQPMGNLVDAIFEFDPRMKTSVLQKEYEELQKGKGSHLYEVSAWNMLMAYDLEAYYAESLPKNNLMRHINKIPERIGKISNSEKATAFLCEYNDDNSILALLDMFNKGLKIRSAKEPFELNGKKYKRGTLLLRAIENPENLSDILLRIAEENHIEIKSVETMRIQKGSDLGGNDFELLSAPKVALLSGPDLSANNVGAIWYLLDQELKLRFSILNHDFITRFDLRKYNVIILPDTWGNPDVYDSILGEDGTKILTNWIEDGGTLIGIGNGAAFIADSSSKMSQVKLRRQTLKELQVYEDALKNEKRFQKKVDSLTVWEKIKPVEIATDKKNLLDIKILEEADKQGQLFQPRGTIFRIDLDEEHWLNFGLNDKVPAVFYSSYAFLSKKPVQTAGRFSKYVQLRLSGLLWPEARARWENTAYVTRESKGKGQIILFADEPNFRSYFYGTARILINAMLLGPGMGTQTVVSW